MWNPTALEIIQAMVVSLADTMPQFVDALFVHGAPIRNDELDNLVVKKVASLYANGGINLIVLNGLTAEDCQRKNLSYGGYEKIQLEFLRKGVSIDDIVVMAPCDHTGAESMELLKIAKEKKWLRLAITSYPHHQLRCFLQIIALMSEIDYFPYVYNIPGPGINWNQQIEKPIMNGAKVFGCEKIKGTFPIHIQEELKRIVTYAQQPEIVDGKKKFTRHATILEMLNYLQKRK